MPERDSARLLRGHDGKSSWLGAEIEKRAPVSAVQERENRFLSQNNTRIEKALKERLLKNYTMSGRKCLFRRGMKRKI